MKGEAQELVCEYCHSTTPADNPGAVRRYKYKGTRITFVLCEAHLAKMAKWPIEIVEDTPKEQE